MRARLHTDTRECARAITYELPPSPYPPARAAIAHIITAREGAIINLGITPQTYMPWRVPSRNMPSAFHLPDFEKKKKSEEETMRSLRN